MSATVAAIRISVDGIPPDYDAAYSISNPTHSRHKQYLQLRTEATMAMASQQIIPRATEVSVTIAWERATKRGTRSICDGTNAISDVANTLEGIVYFDDEQITDVRYTESQAAHDRYVIEVSPRWPQ